MYEKPAQGTLHLNIKLLCKYAGILQSAASFYVRKNSTDSAISEVPNDVFERFQRLTPLSRVLRQHTPAKSKPSYDSLKLFLTPTVLQY